MIIGAASRPGAWCSFRLVSATQLAYKASQSERDGERRDAKSLISWDLREVSSLGSPSA